MRRICLSLCVLVLATACVAPSRPGSTTLGNNVGFAMYGGQLGDSPAVRAADLDRVRASGAKWVRLSLNWVSLEPGGKGRFNWAPADTLVAAALARGLKISAIVAYTPGWARPAGTSGTYPPNRNSDYADFVAAAARRYAPRGVHAWEIWNEPNLFTMWSPRPDVARYTGLLRAAYSAIKGVDRGATVVTGGMSPAYNAPDRKQVLPLSFVQGIYANGGGGFFDAIGHHPSSFPAPSTYEADWNPFLQTKSIYNEMRAHGDGAKKVWATELAFPTGSQGVSEGVQGDRYTEAVRAWRAWSFTGPMFIYSLRDMGTNGDRYETSGIYRNNGSSKASVSKVSAALHATR
jgi:hypothetical protein